MTSNDLVANINCLGLPVHHEAKRCGIDDLEGQASIQIWKEFGAGLLARNFEKSLVGREYGSVEAPVRRRLVVGRACPEAVYRLTPPVCNAPRSEEQVIWVEQVSRGALPSVGEQGKYVGVSAVPLDTCQLEHLEKGLGAPVPVTEPGKSACRRADSGAITLNCLAMQGDNPDSGHDNSPFDEPPVAFDARAHATPRGNGRLAQFDKARRQEAPCVGRKWRRGRQARWLYANPVSSLGAPRVTALLCPFAGRERALCPAIFMAKADKHALDLPIPHAFRGGPPLVRRP